MRIPQGFESRSSQSSVRHKTVTLSTEPDRGRSSLRANTHQTGLLLQQRPPVLLKTAVSQKSTCKEAHRFCPAQYKVIYINKVSELPRNEPSSCEEYTRDQPSISENSNTRSCVSHGTAIGNLILGLSPIHENHQIGQYSLVDYTKVRKHNHTKLTEQNSSHSRFHDTGNSSKLSEENRNQAGRSYSVTSQENVCNTLVKECLLGENHTNVTTTEESQPRLFEGQKTPQTNDVICEACIETDEERLDFNQDRRTQVEESLYRQDITELDYRSKYSQVSLSQDEMSRIMPNNAEPQSLTKPSVEMKTSARFAESANDTQGNTELFESKTLQPQQALIDQKLTTHISDYHGPYTKSGMHNVLEEKMNNNFTFKYPEHFFRCVPEFGNLENHDMENFSEKRSCQDIIHPCESIKHRREVLKHLCEGITQPCEITRHTGEGINPALYVNQRGENADQLPSKKQESKLCEEFKNTNSRILGNEIAIPSPPFGYHVRNDISNPNSTPEIVRTNYSACKGDIPADNKFKTNEPFQSQKVVGPGETNQNGQPWRSLLAKQLLMQNKESQFLLHECLNGLSSSGKTRDRHSKKLMIIGKLNCRNGGHKRIGIKDTNTKLELSREGKYGVYDRKSDGHEEGKLKMKWAHKAVIKNIKKRWSGNGEDNNGEDNIDLGSTHFVNTLHPTESYGSLEDRVQCYCKALCQTGNHKARLCIKKNGRHRTSLKNDNEIRLNHKNVRPLTEYARASHETLVKAAGSQPCLNLSSEGKQKVTYPRGGIKRAGVYTKRSLLPSYYMNVNSNAGIPDSCTEGCVGGKTETKQTSGSSIHSSDQFYSTHTDTEVSGTCSEMEVSPTPSFSREMDDLTVITQRKSEPSLNTNTMSDKSKQSVLGGEENGQNTSQVCNESVLDTLQKKTLEQAPSDKIGNLKSENHVSRSQAALTPLPKETASVLNGRHKKKTKTTEAAIIKFESSVTKKAINTSVAKDGKKPVMVKLRQERPKQVLAPGDVQKAVAVASDKSVKGLVENVRPLKTMKASEGHSENLETKLRQKPVYEAYLDYIALKEPHRQARVTPNAQSQGVRSAESDHRCSPLKNHGTASCRSEDMSQIKRLVSLPKTMPSQGTSYKQSLLPKHHETKSNTIETDYNSEVKSLGTIKSSISSTSPISQKGRAAFVSSVIKESNIKLDVHKNIDTFKEELSDSSLNEFSSSPKRELSKLQEKNEESELSVPVPNELTDKKQNQMETLNSPPATELQKKSESSSNDRTPETDSISRKKALSSHKIDTSRNTSEIFLKHSTKKKISDKESETTTEDVTSRDDQGESSKGKMYHMMPISRKKFMSRYKMQSRSPDGRKKKRFLRRISNEEEDSKAEKGKKQKGGDRLIEKKKKKRKHRQKASESEEDSFQNIQSTMEPHMSRSRSDESNKTTQTILSSASMPHFLTNAVSEPSLSPEGDQEIRSTVCRNRPTSSDHGVLSMNREHVWRPDDLKSKNQAASSAETVSIPSESYKPADSAESILVFNDSFTRSSGKVVQIAVSSKVKKNEKDLQEAELGWNSSTFSVEEKTVTEKPKANQKRAMVRYYIVKPKSKKMEKEIVASKLRHPAPRLNHADADMCTGSNIDANGDLFPQERSKTGQGKSVQFSDNIEDLEAAKEEIASDRPLRKTDSENTPHSAIFKTAEVVKPLSRATDIDIPTLNKTAPQKKDELRPQVTPPRKRRPIWLKKAVKVGGLVKDNTLAKSIPAVGQVKKRHSSDNILKSSRFNIHVYYPVKQMAGSPKVNKMSLGDKRKVAYNTLINSIFLATPMNKATRKLVAKTGSPVDIKEIIEGSSVDAADYYKAIKALNDGTVRAARSVPSLGPQRAAGADSVGRKKIKLLDDFRLTSQKNSKDLKQRDNESPQSSSATETTEDQASVLKRVTGSNELMTSPSTSTNIDLPPRCKQKSGRKRFVDQHKLRRRENKTSKKTSHGHGPKWQVLASKDARNVSDLTQGHYTDDMIEANVLNMGLAWVVQSVVNRLPFLTPRQTQSAIISPRETSSGHELEELDIDTRNKLHEFIKN